MGESRIDDSCGTDSHYQDIANTGVEPILAMETAMLAGIPAAYHAAVLRNFNTAMAIKYQLRCGSKDDPQQELEKASNYLHRARTGRWPREDA